MNITPEAPTREATNAALHELAELARAHCSRPAMSEERWYELDKHYAPAVSVDHASAAVVECLTEIARLEQENTRLIGETHRWSAAVKKLEAERTQPFTEASTEDALAILDYVATSSDISDKLLSELIDAAIQKLRLEPAPVHDAAALEQLARQHPIDLPWMQASAGLVAVGIPSSPLNCDGCAKCQEGGEGV